MTDDKVSFLWRDYAHGHRTRTMTLEAHEFLRRFLLPVLPAGFVRIRYFGLLAPRHRKPALHLCREYLRARLPQQLSPTGATAEVAKLCQHCLAALCGWLRFSLLRDSPSACSHLNRRIPHD
jgi:hypothetical protein